MIDKSDSADRPDDAAAVSPINRLRGELRLPGDKSISHRAAMIASLAEGESVLRNFSSARDCEATIDCLRMLGVEIVQDGATVTVRGLGPAGFREPKQELNAQNSGTTMRLLAGILAAQPFTTTITGDASLLRRPMSRIAEPLRLMGAGIELQPNGCAPLIIARRRPLTYIRYELPVASAQVKSAILLAATAADVDATVAEAVQTRDHTERLLARFGARMRWVRDIQNFYAAGFSSGHPLTAREVEIPGDISSAAFFIATAVALNGSDLVLPNVGLNPTRTGFITALKKMGANITVEMKNAPASYRFGLAGPSGSQEFEKEEPMALVRVKGEPLPKNKTFEISAADVPGLIDELPLLAVTAASLGCAMRLRGARELQFKESDRIKATVDNLRRMGARIEQLDDGWWLQFGTKLRGARLSSFGDHRIAMACAVAALTATGPSRIEGARDSVAVSLPEFWSLLKSVAE